MIFNSKVFYLSLLYVMLAITTPSFAQTGINGMMRYNTNLNKMEVYQNGNWANVGGASQWTTVGGNINYSSGDVGIGSAAPTNALEISRSNVSTQIAIINSSSAASRWPGIGIYNFKGSTAGFPTIDFKTYRGSEGAQSPVILNDRLGVFQWFGASDAATSVQTGAFVAADAAGAFTNTSAPADLILATTSTGSIVAAERVRIFSQGSVGIGTNAVLNGAILNIRGTGLAYSSVVVPRDTTALRPTGINGMLRYNTNLNVFESYANSSWGAFGALNVQTFTVNGTWIKPGAGTFANVECIGGGGSGGKQAGGGGGGGGFVTKRFLLTALTSTVAVTIGAGGAAKATNGIGNGGGNTTFGAFLTAYGGGAGNTGSSGGGGGGGALGAGVLSVPGAGAGTSTAGGQGDDSGGGLPCAGSQFGGGGGAAINSPGGTGCNSYYGGAGGGYWNAGGGGTSLQGGNGGAGVSAASGVNGTQPGGGGGGTNTGATSGAGADGQCIVIVN